MWEIFNVTVYKEYDTFYIYKYEYTIKNDLIEDDIRIISYVSRKLHHSQLIFV